MNLKDILHSLTVGILCNLMLLPACSACSDESPVTEQNPYLNVETTNVNFEEASSEKEITVNCNTTWTYTTQGDDTSWLHLSQDNQSLLISVDENEDKNVRQASIVITASSLQETIEVAQLGWGKAILLSPASASLAAVGGTISLEVTTNVDYEALIPETCEWITPSTDTRSTDSHPVVTTSLTFNVLPNESDAERKDTITLQDTDATADTEPVKFAVTQSGLGEYEALDPDEIADDILVEISSGEASSFQSGEGIENSFDGDKSTIYHSNWTNSGDDYFPITLTYYFNEGSDMDYFVYYPRESGTNGLFKEVDIEVMSNANTRNVNEWKFVMTHDFGGSSSAARVEFPESQIGVSAVRFTIKSGAGDGQGFASCAEMEFYKKNPAGFDYTTLFTDPSCSELKPGITENDIVKCSYSFFKNIAWYMYHDKYELEFRIADYSAYPHPDLQATSNKTSPYSLLDNPTGISVSAGEVLVVMADLQGQSVSLRVQNLDEPGGDGFGGSEYPLADGVNKLDIEEKGLAYVMYHTPDYESAPEIRIHFANGTVNGYYDSQNPDHEGRWKELLDGATDKYFDVVGQYAHLTFPTTRFRNHTSNLKALIDAYDQIVYHEQALMGLEKYGKMFANRMYFNVIYTSYMYATSYHTAYNDETLPELCDESLLTTSSCWGPAHEVGHCNQTRPGLKWLGMTEVTNNIMSQYIQTSVFGQNSRLQTEDMGSTESPNRYSKAWNGIIVAQIAHNAHDDVFCKLVPFWQLELYFGKVQGRTPMQQDDKGGFYPDVYEYVRTHDDLSSAGEQQLEFVYNASVAAGMNLLDFFGKWGFLTPIDQEMDDYGTGQFTVTQTQIDALKERVEALGLPQPEVALEYITDNNWETFKNKASVVKGTATRNDDQLTMKDWQNVIVYEVRENDADGQLIGASDGMLTPSTTATFTVPGGWKDNYKVYAVSFDNQRTEVIF